MTLLLLAAGLVSAQGGYLVKGVVEDAMGPVIGATVLQQGTTNGTTTGLDGDFVLRVPDADALVEISCIGYATQVFKASEVPAKVLLLEDTEFLDEVVVIGYGTLSKKEVSASIVQVDSKDFFRGTTNNPMTMLTGKVAGLNVVTSQGSNPNSGSDYQIRGATSLQAGNGPLVVIDGVPGGDIRSLAPQDIESMTVLKDAASASIYGTAGANGVILVTTKKGSKDEAGTAHVTYDGAFNVNFVKDPNRRPDSGRVGAFPPRYRLRCPDRLVQRPPPRFLLRPQPLCRRGRQHRQGLLQRFRELQELPRCGPRGRP